MRGAEPFPVSGFRDGSHRRPARPQRQDFADPAQLQGSPHGSVRVAALSAHVVQYVGWAKSRAVSVPCHQLPRATLPTLRRSRVEVSEEHDRPKSYRHSTFTTSKALAPPGVTTSTVAPLFL